MPSSKTQSSLIERIFENRAAGRPKRKERVRRRRLESNLFFWRRLQGAQGREHHATARSWYIARTAEARRKSLLIIIMAPARRRPAGRKKRCSSKRRRRSAAARAGVAGAKLGSAGSSFASCSGRDGRTRTKVGQEFARPQTAAGLVT